MTEEEAKQLWLRFAGIERVRATAQSVAQASRESLRSDNRCWTTSRRPAMCSMVGTCGRMSGTSSSGLFGEPRA